MKRLKTIMVGLWYPAVLGTLIVLFLDRWSHDFLAASKCPTAWLGFFLIIYYTVLFEETEFNENYDFEVWVIDLFDVFLVYAAYFYLGYGPGQGHEDPRSFWVVVLVTCLYPVVWRWINRPLNLSLDGLGILSGAVAGSEIYHSCFDISAIAGLFILLMIYVSLVIRRIAGNRGGVGGQNANRP